MRVLSYSLIAAGIMSTTGAVCFAGVGMAGAHTKKQACHSDYLFTQTAASATLSKEANKTFLTLNDINPGTLWFQDRPCRNAGEVSVQKFIKLWNDVHGNSFVKQHPNANLVTVYDKGGMATSVSGVYELSSPVYNAKKGSLRYEIKQTVKQAKLDHSAKSHHVALFIDGWHPHGDKGGIPQDKANFCPWC